jgi:hypothetical protein
MRKDAEPIAATRGDAPVIVLPVVTRAHRDGQSREEF